MASSEIKDKTDITNARKEIERRMERFKLVEKEAKTKTFSKEGLTRALADPKERARAEMRDWLTNTVDSLNTQVGPQRFAGAWRVSRQAFEVVPKLAGADVGRVAHCWGSLLLKQRLEGGNADASG
jgi:hypothetical protein